MFVILTKRQFNQLLDEIFCQFNHQNKILKIMEKTFDDLKQEVGSLKDAVNQFQDKVTTTITGFQDTIKSLQDQIANGTPATKEQLGELFQDIEDAKSDLASTKLDGTPNNETNSGDQGTATETTQP